MPKFCSRKSGYQISLKRFSQGDEFTIKENDVVELLEDNPEFGLKKGDKGTILMILSVSPLIYEIEFMDDKGETLAVESIDGSLVKLFWSAEN